VFPIIVLNRKRLRRRYMRGIRISDMIL
jgi:hypothetical protein